MKRMFSVLPVVIFMTASSTFAAVETLDFGESALVFACNPEIERC